MVPAQNKTAVDDGIGVVKVRPRYASKGGVLISEINSSTFARRLPHCVNISKKFERVEGNFLDDEKINLGTTGSRDRLTRYFCLNKVKKLGTEAGRRSPARSI